MNLPFDITVMALISGIDDSYIGLDLANGYSIHKLYALPDPDHPHKVKQDMLFENQSMITYFRLFHGDCLTDDRQHFYYVERSYNKNCDTDDLLKESSEVFNLLDKSLRMIQLFTECPINAQRFVLYAKTETSTGSFSHPIHYNIDRLKKSVISGVNSISVSKKAEIEYYLASKKLNHHNIHISSAFAFFIHSYLCDFPALSIVLLSSALEKLFLKSGDGKREPLAKRTAMAIEPEDNTKRMHIYEEMLRMYKLRSDYLHDAKPVATTSDVLLIRDYLRKVINKYGFSSSYDKKTNTKQLIDDVTKATW